MDVFRKIWMLGGGYSIISPSERKKFPQENKLLKEREQLTRNISSQCLQNISSSHSYNKHGEDRFRHQQFSADCSTNLPQINVNNMIQQNSSSNHM